MANGMSSEILEQVAELVKRGALFVVNNSGGKDSQAMLLEVAKLVPASQILSLHASLGEAGRDEDGVEWPDTEKWVRYMSAELGVAVEVCKAKKTLLGMVDSSANRLRAQGKYDSASPWPSPKYRQCTSDLKRGPLEKAIRAYIKANGLSGIVVNCVGLRAAESGNRAKAKVWVQKKATKTGAVRERYDWLPIHHLTTDEVFATIAAAGHRPHWAYGAGMSRLSCCFCIMAKESDLTTAARLLPDLFARYVEKERELGKTLRMDGKGLEEVTGLRARVRLPMVA